MTRIEQNLLLEEMRKSGHAAEIFLIDCYSKERSRNNLKQIALTNSLALAIHHLYSIRILLLEKQIYTSQALVRNMIEIVINMQYFYVSQSYENVVQYLYTGEKEWLFNLKAARPFLDWTELEFNKSIEDVNESITKLTHYGHKLAGLPKLYKRAEAVDTKFGGRRMSLLYSSWYRLYSTSTHSGKDLLMAMSDSEDHEHYITGYDKSAEAVNRLGVISLQLLSAAVLFVEKKTRVPIRRKRDRNRFYSWKFED